MLYMVFREFQGQIQQIDEALDEFFAVRWAEVYPEDFVMGIEL